MSKMDYFGNKFLKIAKRWGLCSHLWRHFGDVIIITSSKNVTKL